jgi:hypothetical protein
MGAFFCSAKKPGFPLQFLGFAYANPAGFPLQSPCAAATTHSALRAVRVYITTGCRAAAQNKDNEGGALPVVQADLQNCIAIL